MGTQEDATRPKVATTRGEPRAAIFTVRIGLAGTPVREQSFDQDLVTLGRDPSCDLHLDNSQVSRHHAEIRRELDVFALFDRKSVNGVHVNGQKVEETHLLANGDRIAIGPFEMIFEATATTIVASAAGEDNTANLRITRLRSTSKVSIKTPERVRGYVLRPELPGEASRVFVSELYQVGRAPDSDLVLAATDAPWKAALIVRGSMEYRVVNVLPEPAAVKVNGRGVASYEVLRDGDELEIAGTRLRFATSGGRSASGRLTP